MNTTIRSASAIASSIWWVTNRTDALLAFPDVEEEALHLDARLNVESGEGLIHEQHFRLHGEGAGDSDPLAHAPGKLVRVPLNGFGKADARQNPARRLLAFLGRHAAYGEAEANVLPDVQPGKEGCLLKNQAALGGRSGDRLAVRADRSRSRLFEPGDEVQERGLAATGGTE